MKEQETELQKVKDRVIDILCDFGDGETEFHTRDIEKLYRALEASEMLSKALAEEIRQLKEVNKKLELKLEAIENISEDYGREGCNYGDTEYDSLSAVYGYNLCLSQVKEILTK